MTLNRFLTSLVQLGLCLPIIWYVKELVKERRSKKLQFMRK